MAIAGGLFFRTLFLMPKNIKKKLEFLETRNGSIMGHGHWENQLKLLLRKKKKGEKNRCFEQRSTPPKTNMESKNISLEKEKHLQTTNSWDLC